MLWRFQCQRDQTIASRLVTFEPASSPIPWVSFSASGLCYWTFSRRFFVGVVRSLRAPLSKSNLLPSELFELECGQCQFRKLETSRDRQDGFPVLRRERRCSMADVHGVDCVLLSARAAYDWRGSYSWTARAGPSILRGSNMLMKIGHIKTLGTPQRSPWIRALYQRFTCNLRPSIEICYWSERTAKSQYAQSKRTHSVGQQSSSRVPCRRLQRCRSDRLIFLWPKSGLDVK